jgi:D-methionine transport system ATP-binding protein
LIIVKDLVKIYKSKDKDICALDGVCLEIPKGQIFGVIGLSGAGKSSLVRCISSIEKPTSGEILIGGKNISKLSEKKLRTARKNIGMVFQHFNLLMNRTVFENIAFPLEIHHISRSEITSRVDELLELVGLTDKKNSYPATLSGGQKQRVGIARSLAIRPEILICDEATSALDPLTTHSILSLLKEINKKIQLTMLVITHEMSVIKDICERVAVMESGKIIEEGNVTDVFVKPKTALAKSFFEDKNLLLSHDIYSGILTGNSYVVKVNFIGDNSVDPYISNAIKKFDVDIAILAGNIQQVAGTIIGTLIIEIRGSGEKIKDTTSYFTSEGLLMEVVANDI